MSGVVTQKYASCVTVRCWRHLEIATNSEGTLHQINLNYVTQHSMIREDAVPFGTGIWYLNFNTPVCKMRIIQGPKKVTL
jgi:hypothetical protein